MATESESQRPPSVHGHSSRIPLTLSVLIALTSTRALAIAFIPRLQMFGGEAPDVWLGPWVVDSMLGAVIPFMIWAVLRLRTQRTWGVLLVYNSVGAFDYVNGLLTQWLHPLPASVAPSWLVYASLVSTLAIQLLVIAMLLRRSTMQLFEGAGG